MNPRGTQFGRAVVSVVLEEIAARLDRIGVIGGVAIDAGRLVGVVPPAVGGLPPPAEPTDDAGVVLVDADGVVLVASTGVAAADHTHPDAGGGAPTGPAGGDLAGTYPNPQIGAGVITDADVVAANKDGLAAVASLRTLGTGAQQATAGNDGRLTNARTPTTHAPTHQPGGSDPMAVDAAAGTGSLRTLGTSATSAAAGNDSRFGSGGPPTGAASGHLTGTYPGPSIAGAVVTDVHVATANKDGLATLASMRTLGASATQAAAGNHTHGAAAPAAHATTHQPGGADAMAVDAVAATGSLRTLGAGAQQASAGTHTHGAAAPAAHATTHQPGGADAMAVDAAAGTGSLRTLGTSGTSAAAGNDSRLSDSRAPSGTASGHLTGTYPAPSIANAVVTDAMVVAANKDGAAATASMRTIGAGATQAAAGNHTHGAAAPAAHASTHQPGGSDPMAVDAAAATGSLRTLGVAATAAAAGDHAHAPVATANLLTNPGLEVWQRGAGPFTTVSVFTADRWFASALTSTYSITRIASTIGSAGFSLQVVYTHAGAGTANVYQRLQEGYLQLLGRAVTFTIVLKATVASRARAWINDSVSGYTYSALNAGTGAETLSVTKTVSATATSVTVGVEIGTGSCTVELNDAVLVTGSIAPAFTPLHSAEDLARCLRYAVVVGGLSPFEFVCPLMARAATGLNGVLRFPVEMALTPTFVVSAASHFAVYAADGSLVTMTSIAFLDAGRRSCGLNVGVAAGVVAGNASVLVANNTTAARLTFEANP